MKSVLKDKKVLFFDVGYTLDYPASGDWMFTKKFYEIVGEKLKKYSQEQIQQARDFAMIYLANHHTVAGTSEEVEQFFHYYKDISDFLQMELTEEEILALAQDRTHNMDNYIIYPDAQNVLEILGKTHRLGIISDTWPSIIQQLKTIGVYKYFSFFTFSCDLGVFKPNKKMFLDALQKAGCKPEEAVFIDDSVHNLAGAAQIGITPILIAANPVSDVQTDFIKIYRLSELLED